MNPWEAQAGRGFSQLATTPQDLLGRYLTRSARNATTGAKARPKGWWATLTFREPGE